MNIFHLRLQGDSMSDLPIPFDRLVELIILAVSAISSLVISIIALFGHSIKEKVLRPKLSITVSQIHPFIETVALQNINASAEEKRAIIIRFLLNNSGKSTAHNFKLLIDNIKHMIGNNEFRDYNKIIPTTLELEGNINNSISPLIPYYYPIFMIQEDIKNTTATDNNIESKNEYNLFLRIEIDKKKNTYINLKTGTYRIPFTMYADEIQPIKNTFEIFWSGSSIEDFSDKNFYIKLISGE